jgi:hypothetical protein
MISRSASPVIVAAVFDHDGMVLAPATNAPAEGLETQPGGGLRDVRLELPAGHIAELCESLDGSVVTLAIALAS